MRHRPARGLSLLMLACTVAVAAAQDGDAIAIVNGTPISRRVMVDALLEAHGVPMLQQLVVLELAKEEARRLKLTVTAEETEREFQRALQKIAPDKDAAGTPLTDADRRQALEMLLQQKGVSLTEFRLGMERNAYLRKVVEARLQLDEATVREEYARLYGEKVEVRHVQVADISGLHAALDRLERKQDFAEIARAVSENQQSAARGGLLPPFAFNDDEIAPVLREAAFALEPGEVSKPIQVGRWWHIVRLERRIPSSGAPFEQVRAEVERSLRERAVSREMNNLITTLFKKAQIRVLEPELKRRYDKVLKESTIVTPEF